MLNMIMNTVTKTVKVNHEEKCIVDKKTLDMVIDSLIIAFIVLFTNLLTQDFETICMNDIIKSAIGFALAFFTQYAYYKGLKRYE